MRKLWMNLIQEYGENEEKKEGGIVKIDPLLTIPNFQLYHLKNPVTFPSPLQLVTTLTLRVDIVEMTSHFIQKQHPQPMIIKQIANRLSWKTFIRRKTQKKREILKKS
ncbi:unnamed protein product [Allacma fusca]|uniref:Uncharacterized protein n=1 Tax=Allacma fusca TaxID=39272 RepID=A0A8J2L5D8_9HEXA|nr:unnamed protein product [Allacma fusca]